MNHSFNIEIAKEAGVNGAVILENLYFWQNKNKANDKNFFDGDYWVYNSIKAWNKLFPYFSEKQIRSALKKIESLGFIKTGNYSKLKYNRTKWYSLTEKTLSILEGYKRDISICTKGQNSFVQKGKTLLTDINLTTINKDNTFSGKEPFVLPTRNQLIIIFKETASKYKWKFDYELEADTWLEWTKNPKCNWKDWKSAARNWARRIKTNGKYRQMNWNNYGSDQSKNDYSNIAREKYSDFIKD